MENFGNLTRAIVLAAIVLALGTTALCLLWVIKSAEIGERGEETAIITPKMYRLLLTVILLAITIACVLIGATLY